MTDGAYRGPALGSHAQYFATAPPFTRLVPMQRLPKPSDYGRAAAFLASEDAAMITGIDLRVDGGAVAKYWAWDPSAGPR